MAMYRAVREKHCRHRLSVAGFATQRYGISPRSEGEALMAMMAKQRLCCAQQELALQRHCVALRGMAWKARAPHSPVPEAPLSYGKAKRNTVPLRKSIACPGYAPRYVATRRDGCERRRTASEARCTARKRAAKE